jgi:predicted metal-dependent peptidase
MSDATKVIERCRASVNVLGFTHPSFLLIHARIRDLYQVVSKGSSWDLDTMGITVNGRILINEKFVDGLSKEELQGVLAHEMLHLVLMHHGRRGGRDSWMWNVATDMCINHALRQDDIKLPQDCLYPPPEYNGDIFAEALFEWLKKNPKHMPKGKACPKCGGTGKVKSKAGKSGKGKDGKDPGDGQGKDGKDPGDGQGKDGKDGSGGQDPGDGQGQGSGQGDPGDQDGDGKCSCQKNGRAGAGCGVLDEDDNGNPDKPNWKQIAIEARAHAQAAGRGTSGVASLLAPRVPKVDWKRVIRHGFEATASKPSRDFQTYAKRNRRSPEEGVQFPGWRGYNPSIAVVIDVSGSMDREWINLIVAETISLMKTFTGVKVFLAVHTSELVWAGWLSSTETWKLSEAVSFSGGTDPQPAYDAVAAATKGKADNLLHFTDTEFGQTWPVVPAKHLIVGAVGRQISTKPPLGAQVIFIDSPERK